MNFSSRQAGVGARSWESNRHFSIRGVIRGSHNVGWDMTWTLLHEPNQFYVRDWESAFSGWLTDYRGCSLSWDGDRMDSERENPQTDPLNPLE